MQENYQIYRTDSSFSILLDEKKELPFIPSRLDQVWEKLTADPKRTLFNGSVFHVDTYNERTQQLSVYPGEYKTYYAQIMDPELFRAMSIFSIGMTGITKLKKNGTVYYLIAKRSASTNQGGFFEFAPAGSFDAGHQKGSFVDCTSCYTQELEEETGLLKNSVLSLEPRYLIRCEKERIFEVIVEVELDPSAMKNSQKKNEEYSEILWLEKNKLKEHFANNTTLPFAHELLKLIEN
jgi:8-oxo-dGTP pyrophosphatase MutT (NUDIX family)